MIVVFTAPKGGVGKTSIVKQLSFYLPKTTQYLDLDFNQGLSDVMKLKQPDPQEIDVDYIESLLPKYYDDGLLVIDCGGYMTDAVMTAIAKSDKIYTPVKQGDTNKKIAEKMKGYLSELAEQMDFDYQTHCFYTDVAWNANREKLVESLTGIDHITPLPIAISTNGEIRRLKKSKNERTVEEMTFLAQHVLEPINE